MSFRLLANLERRHPHPHVVEESRGLPRLRRRWRWRRPEEGRGG
uniref:Uncharacterized protein n=1 Tax=Arundo donax TaxID=35708 RepID=A0A0A9GV83_ARUDO